MLRASLGLAGLMCMVFLVRGGALAQEPNPGAYDFTIRLDAEAYAPGDTVTALVGVVAREPGIQGWSYGVRHDPALLTLSEATIDGTDVPGALVEPSFQVTTVIEEDGVAAGFIQGVVLSLIHPAEVPVSDFFSMAKAVYNVSSDACEGREGDITTLLRFVEDLAVPGSPPVGLNLTVGGRALVPAVVENGEVVVRCAAAKAPLRLFFAAEEVALPLPADGSSTAGLEVRIENNGTQSVAFQGWSYAVGFDGSLLDAVDAAPGADVAALNGGSGPDFLNYNLDETSADGTVSGVTVGAVVALGPPGTEVLPLPPGAAVHLDTIQLRSAVVLVEGEEPVETPVRFADGVLGGDAKRPPLEIIFVVEGESVIPDFSSTQLVRLLPAGGAPRFIRGDANNDARVDISDGIWIVNMLFYGGEMTACRPAADANGDAAVDLSDAMFIINYQLQPGATPETLFPAPRPPFPECGTADGVTVEMCPRGSHVCFP